MPTTSTSPAVAHRRRSRRRPPPPRQPWCCSFGLDPLSSTGRSPVPAPPRAKPTPQLSRRIRSPGRVSPIDDLYTDATSACPSARLSSVSEYPLPPLHPPPPPPAAERPKGSLRLRLVAQGLILEVDEVERVRRESMVIDKVLQGGGGSSCGEVAMEGNVEVWAVREVVEMMLEEDDKVNAMRRLTRGGVEGAISLLEVSFTLMFDRGVHNCLNYLEAVPWNEPEEEKIKSLLSQHSSHETASRDLLIRLQTQNSTSSTELVSELIQSITKGANNNARKELRTLVDSILSRTPICVKRDKELDKTSIYRICDSCLNSLVELFEEASDLCPADQTNISVGKGPLERIYKQVEDLNWLLKILIDRQMGVEFVDIWANQKTLATMHKRVSPMVRYELSRISATIFIAMGSGNLRCNGEKRLSIFQAWFGPMLVDFGWLRRCPKGLNMTTLEEGIGQSLLTLALTQQQALFMDWFEAFGRQGRECPNLMKAFQIWWRRSFVRPLVST
ncbi:unnamed protein product [Alopecurus aequalis]